MMDVLSIDMAIQYFKVSFQKIKSHHPVGPQNYMRSKIVGIYASIKQLTSLIFCEIWTPIGISEEYSSTLQLRNHQNGGHWAPKGGSRGLSCFNSLLSQGKQDSWYFFPVGRGANPLYDPQGSLEPSIGIYNYSQNWAPEPLHRIFTL